MFLFLTEPPPDNREKMAEIFFETFNARGLYIGVSVIILNAKKTN